MQFKNLVTSALFLGLSISSVLAGHGRVSFYESAPTKSKPGSCGEDYIVDYYIAISGRQYNDDLCGRCIKIVYNNKYLVGKLVDECPDCPSGGLDISPSMFSHFAPKKDGVFNADWEYVSCDNYGKKSTCSGSDCGKSSSSSDSKKSTTTTSKAAPSTTVANTVKSTSVNVSTTDVVGKATPTATPVNTSASSTANAQATSASSTPNATTTNGKANEVNNDSSNNGKDSTKEKVAGMNENSGEENSTNIAVPITTGVIMVSGAAGIGLVYLAKSKRESVQDLKQKFPDAFKNIKRSLTKKKTLGLPTTNTDVDNVNKDTTNKITDLNEKDISETRINVN
ncbi:hypothetical protein LY90DRAFT_380374 [Neocallimastix californiae]|jgi:hypothetical protein|uniref:RlpA-like protein double-psi beta-barrel domain-containing protein n=1 Tax=Neocallimastix californiae TaxID=1754190 RepID=A0A1Y2E1A3_9FUNG|nr:hypothetical protein LY90DRAFT_380374 [Neocallimastix californiae]|eukprot:ORY64645.1 hypothetical protein LY90DRAFT_380374 [Neocallimastix californiae]